MEDTDTPQDITCTVNFKLDLASMNIPRQITSDKEE